MQTSNRFRKITALMVCILLFSAVMTALPVSADTLAEGKTVTYDGASWMTELPDQVGGKDVLLSQLSLVATHDTGTFNILVDGEKCFTRFFDVLQDKVGWLLGMMFRRIGLAHKAELIELAQMLQVKVGQCQTLDIMGQLNAGVRMFDLRYRYDGGQFNIYHGSHQDGFAAAVGVCECYDKKGNRLTLRSVFSDFRTFLDAHKGETILFYMSNEGGEESDAVTEALIALEEEFGIYVKIGTERSDDVTPYANRYESLASLALKDARGNVYDTEGEDLGGVDASAANYKAKLEKIAKALNESPDYDAVTGFRKMGLNVYGQVFYFHDPDGVCKIVPKLVLTSRFPFVRLTLDWDQFVVSPRSQAERVNTIVSALADPVRLKSEFGVELSDKAAIGIVTMDFATEYRCCCVVMHNAWTGVTFTSPF